MQQTNSTCIDFMLAQDHFGLPLWQIREILPAGRIFPVPLAPATIRGLANHRGKVITLIDVARVFNRPLPPVPMPEDRLAIVLAPPYEHLGLYVHSPIVIIEASSVDSRPAVREHDSRIPMISEVPGPTGTSIETVHGTLHLLKLDRLVRMCEFHLLDQSHDAI